MHRNYPVERIYLTFLDRAFEYWEIYIGSDRTSVKGN